MIIKVKVKDGRRFAIIDKTNNKEIDRDRTMDGAREKVKGYQEIDKRYELKIEYNIIDTRTNKVETIIS